MIGFQVLSIITDNNAINKKKLNLWLCLKYAMFTKFCHIGNYEYDSIQSVPLCTLQKLHGLEFQSVLKYCYKLTSKAFFLLNLQRQNANLIQQIFNE